MKTEIYSNNAPKPIGPNSQAIKHGNMIFISGQIAIDYQNNNIINENIIGNLQSFPQSIQPQCTLGDFRKCF